MKRAIHYSGGVKFTLSSGVTVRKAPGLPACVSGVRAKNIRDRGDQTDWADKVTCAWCRNKMAREKYDRFKPPFKIRTEQFIQDLKKLYRKYNVSLVGRVFLSDGEKEFEPGNIEITQQPTRNICPTCGCTQGSALCLQRCGEK